MVFKIKNKVALVTGGASGIGLCLAKELLKNGAKGVTLADVNVQNGEKVANELNQEFGSGKVIFVKTDVTDKNSFENAFKETVKNFKNVDILCNNAGIMNEVDWEKTVDINLKGNIIGLILAMENYIKNHKQDEEGVIINTASSLAIEIAGPMQTYTATKIAILGLTKAWGHRLHYEANKVKVIAILPGLTHTPIVKQLQKQNIRKGGEKILAEMMVKYRPKIQSSEFVAQETMPIIEKASTGSAWFIEDKKPAYEFILPDISAFEKNTLK